MKVTSVLVITTLALVSIDRASAAATCTETDLETIFSLTTDIMADQNCMGVTDSNAKCPDAKCFPTLEKVAQEMPDCIVDGMNAKETYAKDLKDCKDKSAASHGFSTSVGVALATAVGAVTMFCL